ncbi:MAG: polysaccharide deacetylase family protein [Chloroflexi bacterium]|nr:polysaccharide deacetylase family protein [Chloroflexota bacterium]
MKRLLLLLFIILVSACSTQPTPTQSSEVTITITNLQATATPVPAVTVAVKSNAVTNVPNNQNAQPFVGEYHIQEFTLELRADGNIGLTQAPQTSSGKSNIWRGTWRIDNNTAIVRITQTDDGKALSPIDEIRFTMVEGFPTIVGGAIPNITTNPDSLTFTLGTGQRSPLVRQINRMLAQYDYLNYKYPERNDDLYNETLRNAVTNFQQSQKLSPTGAVDAHTWQALLKPIVPLPKTAPITHLTPITTDVFIRSGPNTSYAALSKLQVASVMDVVGKIVGATPETMWWQVCCISDQKGWVRGDVVSVSGPTDVVPVVAAPPSPTPVPQAAPKPGKQLVDHLATHAPDGSPVVYLTFDDGPSTYTQKFLDSLKKYNAHGTFFVIGSSAKLHPDLVRSEATAGHYVGNHTYTHISLQNVSHEVFVNESEQTRTTLLSESKDLFGLDGDVHYLRPPYGATDSHTRSYAAELGYQVTMWDIDPMDWRRPGTEAIYTHILRNVYPGAVVLMHDGGGDRSQSAAALDVILQELSKRGFKFYNIFGQ